MQSKWPLRSELSPLWGYYASYSWRLLAVASWLLLAPVQGSALQYRRVAFDPPLVGITAIGPIVPGDFDRLDAFVKELSPSDRILGFFVDSPGGNIFEAEKNCRFHQQNFSSGHCPEWKPMCVSVLSSVCRSSPSFHGS